MNPRPTIESLSDPIDLARALVRCPSVTPDDAGALALLQEALETLGFTCNRLTFSDVGTPDVENLYARLGDSSPNFCFAGHTDVVPVGDADAWTVDPFGAVVDGDWLLGRGASDMKGSIAAFVAAVSRLKLRGGLPPTGSISLLITGDEEGPAINGTAKVLGWLAEQGERIDHCLVGEPTNPTALGDMVKIGRRGSLNARLTVFGAQGHVAYPHLADNPIPRLLEMLRRIIAKPLDEGTDYFQPSNLEITTIDVGNPATNVIPGEARAGFNIRFNDHHSADDLSAWLHGTFDDVIAELGGTYSLEIAVTAHAFLTEPGHLSEIIVNAVRDVTGRTPELSTTGGTSDARFIKSVCPVAEFGLVSETMHKVDEKARIADIRALTDVYAAILERYFRS